MPENNQQIKRQINEFLSIIVKEPVGPEPDGDELIMYSTGGLSATRRAQIESHLALGEDVYDDFIELVEYDEDAVYLAQNHTVEKQTSERPQSLFSKLWSSVGLGETSVWPVLGTGMVACFGLLVAGGVILQSQNQVRGLQDMVDGRYSASLAVGDYESSGWANGTAVVSRNFNPGAAPVVSEERLRQSMEQGFSEVIGTFSNQDEPDFWINQSNAISAQINIEMNDIDSDWFELGRWTAVNWARCNSDSSASLFTETDTEIAQNFQKQLSNYENSIDWVDELASQTLDRFIICSAVDSTANLLTTE